MSDALIAALIVAGFIAQLVTWRLVVAGRVTVWVGMGVTMAILFWFLNRGVAKAKLGEKPKPAASAATTTANKSEAA